MVLRIMTHSLPSDLNVLIEKIAEIVFFISRFLIEKRLKMMARCRARKRKL
jgi:hypothetical protein